MAEPHTCLHSLIASSRREVPYLALWTWFLALMILPAPGRGARGADGPSIRGSQAWIEKVGAHDPGRAGMDDPTYGAESNPTGEPIGGAAGYSRIVEPDAASVVVRTGDQFIDALGKATTGTVIYVADDAVVDLTAHDNIVIPGHVTIASGRGRNGSEGALVFTQTVKSTRLFRTGGPNIRITGLRLEGSYPGRERLTQRPVLMGTYHPNVEVDNCEIFAWSCAALGVGSGAVEGAWVHHNYIHHCQRAGLGYGVSLGRTHVLIEGNLFDFCRHAIASSGVPHSGYTARYNVHLEHTISHVFDMHGARDFEKYKQVGLWHFDDGKGARANDYSITLSGDHDGTLCHMDDTAWVEGRIDGGLRFDGRDDYVDVGKERHLAPKSGLTLAAWIKPDSVKGTQAIFSKADTGARGSGYSLRIVDVALEGALYTPDGKRCAKSAGAIRPGEWQHVAMTWQGKKAILYVDGQPVGEFACKGRKLSGNRLLMGRDSATASNFFRGVMDEARVYNRGMSAADMLRQFKLDGDIAGRLILMHHNTIRPTNHFALTLRGRPSVGCWVHHNRFYLPEGAPAVRQVNATGNFHLFDNEHLGLDLTQAPDFSKAPLFGHWTFDQAGQAQTRDESGRGRVGVVTGTVAPAAWERTQDGRALRLETRKRWVSIPKAPDDAFPERVAIGLRMKIDHLREHQVLLDNGLFRIFHRGGWAGHRLYFLCHINENERAGESSWSHSVGVRTKREVKEGEWFQVVGERDGAVMRIYLNGMLESEVECAGQHTVSTNRRGALRVGENVDGAVDDLWIRSAARPDEGEEPKPVTRRLFLTGDAGYEQDGVSPDAGAASTLFRFRVVYRDAEGRAPAIGFPRVHILRDGKSYVNEAPVTMLAENDAPFAQGRTYTYTMRLPKGTQYQHFFEVEAADGEAYKSVRLDGPRVDTGSSAPVLSWTSQSGYSRGGVRPWIGDVTTDYDFRVLFSDLDGDPPMDGHPQVHILKGGKEIEGSPFPTQPMSDVPTWQGRPYRFRTKLAAGENYSHFFTAKDAEGNEAPKTLIRRRPTVDAGGDVAPPDLSDIRVTELTARSATITWQTDEPATSLVEFGADAAYGQRAESATPTTTHAVRLEKLDAGATYHYRVVGADAAGNRALSGDYVFRTPAK